MIFFEVGYMGWFCVSCDRYYPGDIGRIDIIAHPNALVFRWRETKADVSDPRQFISRLHGDDVGIYFSVSGFTREAEKETRSDARQLRLMDFERFFGLWCESDLGLARQKAAIEAYSKQKNSVIQNHTYSIHIPIWCESTSTYVRASAQP